LWNGFAYSPLTIDLPGTPVPYTADASNAQNDMYIGFSTEGDSEVSQLNTVTNAGSASAFPIITISRSGGTSATLESIVNHTTGDQLLFNHPMLDGEKLVIDLTPGHKTIVTYAGTTSANALNDLLPISDFSTFCLMPGDNQIEVYISTVGSPTLAGFIQWDALYSSADG